MDLCYKVGEHTFNLSFSEVDFDVKELGNYTPFLVELEALDCLFHLSVIDKFSSTSSYLLIGQFNDDIASISIFKSEEGDFQFQIAYPGGKEYCTMYVDSLFKDAYVKLPDNTQLRIFCLNNCLMLLYAFATARLDTILIHASVIKNDDEGFVFLGKSGTGKSTHSQLWLEHIEGSKLLNDDNPVICIIENKAYVYGTPWSGKTPCYKNDNTLLKGIIKLRQSPNNQIKKLSQLQAYATILPTCSNMRWENDIASGVHRTVERLISIVSCHQLDCLPDKAAAELSYNTMRNK